MSHYTKEELDSYRNARMSILGRINCSVHLRECKTCQKLLEELEEDDKLIKDIRSSVDIYEALSAGPAKSENNQA
ncbi:MAG: hypothetical protein E7040_02425 [Lentisphaerae bacterium]|nr:hypothetical protein [Lentisphaerota bacterium]